MLKTILALCLAWFPQGDGVKETYGADVNRTYLKTIVQGLDDKDQPRRVGVLASYAGQQYPGTFAAFLSLELVKPAQRSGYTAEVRIVADGNEVLRESASLRVSTMDAETQQLTAPVSMSAFLMLCQAEHAEISIDGIRVRLDKLAALKKLAQKLR